MQALKDQPAKLADFLQQAGLIGADLPACPPGRSPTWPMPSFVFLVATILVACCLIPAAFLPRSKPQQPVDPTALVGH